MSHLPECAAGVSGSGLDCICAELRACEKRAYTLGIEVGKHDGWLAGHAAGVAAARDAVAEVEHIGYYAEEVRDAALAAIDALTLERHADTPTKTPDSLEKP